MPLHQRRPRFSWTLPIVLLAAACTDGGAPTGPDGSFAIQATVTVNESVGTVGQFAFLEPLVDGDPAGPLATGLSPLITICNTTLGKPGTGCIVLEADENGSHYQANWKDKTAEPEETYTMTVSTSFGLRIGELDLFLDGLSGDKAGRTFPIKFWVGEGLGDVILEAEDCIGDDRCNAAPVPADDPAPVVVTTKDENGEPMGVLTFPSGSVPAGGLVVTLDCRKDGFLPTQGPLPTALRQWPLFCSVIALNPDGTPFTGTLSTPATIDVCIVDELDPGQDPLYHGFDHDDLVLGKSNGPGNFEFLTKVPTNLECEGNTYTAMNEPGSPFDVLGSRFASAVGFFMPQPLRAAPMRFRDGGVGGQLGSFSDINPVEPAYIEGTVSRVYGGDLAGVTVTLGGSSSGTTTTDQSGAYRFGPLQAVDGGSSYSVTVSDLPAGQTAAQPSQTTVVNGSGTVTVDFVTAIYNADNGSYYGPVTGGTNWVAANSTAMATTFGTCQGHLATITSANETAFALANLTQAADDGYLLGGQYVGGVWTWVTGETWDYTNWHAGEPSGDGNVLQFYGRWGVPIEEWNDTYDVNPTFHLGYVVEFDGPCS